MILLLGSKLDTNLSEIFRRLKLRGTKSVRVNYEELNSQTFLHLSPESLNKSYIQVGKSNVNLSEISSIFFRGAGSLRFRKSKNPSLANLNYHETVYSHQLLVNLLSNKYWLNEPQATYSSLNRLIQGKIASELGIETPRTIVTQDPDRAMQFIQKFDNQVITKQINQGRYEEGCGNIILTNKVSEEEIKQISLVKNCPTLFQQYIKPKYEYRVIYIGGKIFSFRIHTKKTELVDWRRDTLDSHYELKQLPETVTIKLTELMHKLSLNYGALDLIESNDGKFYFLEVNPSGQFSWLSKYVDFDFFDIICDELESKK